MMPLEQYSRISLAHEINERLPIFPQKGTSYGIHPDSFLSVPSFVVIGSRVTRISPDSRRELNVLIPEPQLRYPLSQEASVHWTPYTHGNQGT
jgi:hypothetical protein